MTIVRAAAGTDLPELSRLWHEKTILQQQSDRYIVLTPAAHKQWLEEAATWVENERCVIYVAQGEQELLGYIIGWIQDAPPGLAHSRLGAVTDMMVDAHSQKSGVGRLLLQTLREWFRNQGIQQLIAYVPAHLAVEQAFWQAQGVAEWMNVVWLK